jgi:hypothetical protein
MSRIDFDNTEALIKKIQYRLHHSTKKKRYLIESITDIRNISSVLFPLGHFCDQSNDTSSLCLVLNLRSALVRQAGDLCCPGGGLTIGLDGMLARLLTLPFFSLSKWPHWAWWQKHDYLMSKQMALCYAAAQREGVEEMRLNPLGLTFLGPLPTQHLAMFSRTIFPFAVWINSQKRFFPNWEVERIVYLPLKELLNPVNYARYRLHMSFHDALHVPKSQTIEFLCYLHRHDEGTDILWGATFRITMDFLQIIFGFLPPHPDTLPVVERCINDTYLNRNGSE